MTMHMADGEGMPLCGMRSGRKGRRLDVTIDRYAVNCSRCLKRIDREVLNV